MSAGFVCPWCASSFRTRLALDSHWLASPHCLANRGVSNQTSSKYAERGMAEDGGMLPVVQPGAATLRLVEKHRHE